LLAASCATGVFQAVYFTAVSRTGAALATAIVFGIAPVATGLCARAVDKSSLGYGWALATACAVTGCSLLLLPGHATPADVLGVALAVVAGICYAIYTVAAKHLTGCGLETTTAVSVTLITGGLILMPWLATAGSGLFTSRALLTIAWLGPVTTAAAYMLFVKGLATVPAATAGTLSLAEPLIAAILAISFLHEHLTTSAVLGCALLITALLFTSRPPSRRAQTSSRPEFRQAFMALLLRWR
jgi:DME family drug/metabolite transporter